MTNLIDGQEVFEQFVCALMSFLDERQREDPHSGIIDSTYNRAQTCFNQAVSKAVQAELGRIELEVVVKQRQGGVMKHFYKDGQVVLVRPIIPEEGNAYGCVLSWREDIEAFVGIMCGHGGSHWLCSGCADRLWQEGGCYTVEGDVPEIGPPSTESRTGVYQG